MEQTIKTLQALQIKALKKGIHSFSITARFTEGEPWANVSIFRTGDDNDDNDYLSVTFYYGKEHKFRLMEVAAFIGEEL